MTYSKESMTRLAPRLAVLACACALVLLAQLVAVRAADAAISFKSFTGSVVDENGDPVDQAGAHPFEASTAFEFDALPNNHPVEDVKDVVVSLPPGLVGYPLGVPRCAADLSTQVFYVGGTRSGALCPPETQVGVAEVNLAGNVLGPPDYVMSIFNLEPPRGVPARFGFTAVIPDIRLDGRVRPGDHGIDIVSSYSGQGLPVNGVKVTLWGVPADSGHDVLRRAQGCELGAVTTCASSAARKPFITTPMDCSAGPLTTTIRANSWQNPDQWATASFSEDVSQSPPFPMEVRGCEKLAFEPDMSLQPTSTAPDAPTGLEVNLSLAQNENPDGLDTAHLEKAVVTLPEGMTISPSAASGLDACSDAQLALQSTEPASCPDGSKIGTVTVDTPLLEQPIDGSVYIRSQASSDPQSGEMFRMALELRSDERGVVVKLPGQIRVDAATGRLQTTFDNNPQMPFSNITLRFKGGARAPLATPTTCGTKTSVMELTSWAGHVETLTDSFTIACPSGAGFTPAFDAGTTTPTGGSFSPLVARIDRDDRQQFLSGVRVDMPRGLLAKLAGVPPCGSTAADNGGCPAGSRIGTVTTAAGPGSDPFWLNGAVYLTTGYKGAPYGLAVHVHAKAGPFDLGWVRVRQALHVDRQTAEVSVLSDALPQIVAGVPVRLRTVHVDIDRPDFTINPTSCGEKRVGASFTSIDGAVHQTGSRFRAADCQALPFEPRLGLRLTGRKQVRTGKHPGVKAVVRQTGVGEAGIRRVKVTLPKSLALDPDNAQALCEFADGTKPDLERHCPKGSIIGRTRAKTPLLGRDLVGNVYFVKNVERNRRTGALIRKLPMIVVALRGEIAINLVGKSSTSKDGRLVNTFGSVPDAPISRFNLDLQGGSKGIFVVTRTSRASINLCAKPRGHIADNRMNGQNGKVVAHGVRVKTPCAPKRARRGK